MSDATKKKYTDQAIVLTLVSLCVGGAIAKFIAVDMAAIFVSIVSLALFWIWLSRDVPTLEERIAESEARRAKPAPKTNRA